LLLFRHKSSFKLLPLSVRTMPGSTASDRCCKLCHGFT